MGKQPTRKWWHPLLGLFILLLWLLVFFGPLLIKNYRTALAPLFEANAVAPGDKIADCKCQRDLVFLDPLELFEENDKLRGLLKEQEQVIADLEATNQLCETARDAYQLLYTLSCHTTPTLVPQPASVGKLRDEQLNNPQ